MIAMRLCVVVLLAMLGCGGGGSNDMSDVDAGSDALKPFGASCDSDKECSTGLCFVGGMKTFCTMRCMPQTVMTDCPMPPTSGVCNNFGFCK